MILLLDTSTPVCKLTLIKNTEHVHTEWAADRQLAHGLLGHLIEQLRAQDADWDDLTGIGVFQGPGSFTGLRIGLTVLNTLADAKSVPIVGVTGDDWQEMAIKRLQRGDDDKIVLPLYGAEANITKPRK